MGPEILAVIAGMLGVTLIGGSRIRARRRRTARAGASGWAPAVAGGASFATATPTGRWGESRTAAADFDEWHEEEAPPAAAPELAPATAAAPPESTRAPFTLEPDLDELGDDELDAVFAGRAPATGAAGIRQDSGRFGHDEPVAPLVPDARSVFEDVDERPRGGAAAFGHAPRRGGGLGGPAVRAAAYAAVGIALVAVIVNVALGTGDAEEPAAAPPTRTQTAPAPVAKPAGPTPEEIAAQRDAAAAAAGDAALAVTVAERRARSAERRRAAAEKRRRAAAAKRRRQAADRQNARPAPPAGQPPAVPMTPSNPVPRPGTGRGGGGSGGGGGGGGGGGTPPCEFGCVG